MKKSVKILLILIFISVVLFSQSINSLSEEHKPQFSQSSNTDEETGLMRSTLMVKTSFATLKSRNNTIIFDEVKKIISEPSKKQKSGNIEYLAGGSFDVFALSENKYVVESKASRLRLRFTVRLLEDHKIEVDYVTALEQITEKNVVGFVGKVSLPAGETVLIPETTNVAKRDKKKPKRDSYYLAIKIEVGDVLLLSESEWNKIFPLYYGGLKESDIKLQRALECIFTRKYDQAIRLCKSVLTKEPRNVLALERLGSAYFLNGQKDKAEESWEMGLMLQPDNAVIKKFLMRLKTNSQ